MRNVFQMLPPCQGRGLKGRPGGPEASEAAGEPQGRCREGPVGLGSPAREGWKGSAASDLAWGTAGGPPGAFPGCTAFRGAPNPGAEARRRPPRKEAPGRQGWAGKSGAPHAPD